MRILYENQIDELTSGSIIASTENTNYPATNIQDQRLTTPWKTTSATDQTILFNAGGSAQPMFQATTNLLSDPEDFTQASWLKNNCYVSAYGNINGIPAFILTGVAAGSVSIYKNYISTATTYSTMVTVRKGSAGVISRHALYNQSAGTFLSDVRIDFSAKTVTYTIGAPAGNYWIDDETVKIGVIANDVATVGNNLQYYMYVGAPAGATGQTAIYSAPILTATPYPLEYTATTRAAWATTYPFRMPPSGKFIVDTVIRPFFSLTTPVFHRVFSWYVSTSQRFMLYYLPSGSIFRILWQNLGAGSTMSFTVPFDLGTAQTLYQNIRFIASIDLSVAGVTSGSRLIMFPRKQGNKQEITIWSGAIDAATPSTFTSFHIGHENNYLQLNSMMKYCRVYGGLLENTITTEQDVDDELKTKDLLFDQTFQGQFDINSLAILGHTITQGASIKAELNDWNEWNYTDGSGSSIIQETLTWNKETILKFLSSKVKRQYAKFTINDPNNEDGIISVARMWIGEYETIDPSSLLDFRVRKKRSDVVIYGRNRQKFSNPGVGWREFQLSFPPTSTTTLSIIQDLYDTVGNHSSIIFCNFDSIRNYAIVEPCYCSINGDLEFTHDRHMKFRYDLNLEEDK